MNANLESLQRDSGVASGMWWGLCSAITAIVLRDKGETAVNSLWSVLMSAEQGLRYREGLEKLGIGENEPPAVKAAKYHYFSNSIGGLNMQYIEESKKKVWIRYLAPVGSFPGVALIAMPRSIRKTIYSTWHPRNGELMGCPQLGWVLTKLSCDGEPYDEGYFFEYDHELSIGERAKFSFAHKTPPFIEGSAPKLDPAMWPEERILKARRNFAGDYLRVCVDTVYAQHGRAGGDSLISQALGIYGVQTYKEYSRLFNIDSNDAAAVGSIFKGLLSACNQQYEIASASPREFQLMFKQWRPFENGLPETTKEALFTFYKSLGRSINGQLRIDRRNDGVNEVWTIVDTGKWLW